MNALHSRLSKALTANYQFAEWPEVQPRETEPTGDGVFVGGLGGAVAPQSVLLFPFGYGAPFGEFDLRVWGWRHVGEVAHSQVIWFPYLIAEFACVLGDVAGLGARLLNANEFFCQSLTLTRGSLGPYDRVQSLGEGFASYVKLDPEGCSKYQVAFRRRGSAYPNALVASASAY